MALSPVLLEVLACPEDKGPLYYLQDENALYNPRLTRRYRIEDDIPVMLIEEAETVDADEAKRIMAKVSSEGIKPTFDGGSSEDAAT
ncbi:MULTISPECIES: Trm112 family protein [Candidatus Microthrix]|jgi:uncharacterized protein YbaR (Trm112 family)|uniref:UPF0434 protein BN381_10201 n=1 Tax=Candidatus Neomicrothrix parvicella RN1 TaxID=1229780 RepID=R4YVX4_9ACTN|nr:MULTISPECIES: Trm112 family protein [Microthrix]NLH67969.1 Trm112 family protein [Candidatus Microthrix parvicella]MBK6501184.1 Trm112 family protein [Candidatus Microthrix sp.]MBK7019795.1 Trm112 family protein [Candidatus Microthrix sp.]MBK7323578.1 Trm112 family protein [Candidatus Microthrix sp.]MBL0205382.1 Trm112 family protein [Candidatus Microthrix sp.]